MQHVQISWREIFPQRLKARRRQLKLTQQKVADGLGISNVRVCQLEEGSKPSAENLVHLARVLQTTTDWLLGIGDGTG